MDFSGISKGVCVPVWWSRIMGSNPLFSNKKKKGICVLTGRRINISLKNSYTHTGSHDMLSVRNQNNVWYVFSGINSFVYVM